MREIAAVNNSAFTSSIAVESIAAAHRISTILGLPDAHENWTEITTPGRLFVPFNSSLNYHPEFDGYEQGMVTRQADVQFMQYPLQTPMPAQVAANDMALYDKVLHGPSMTYPFFAINYLQLANRPELASQRPMYLEKAAAEFVKSYSLLLPNFYSFLEGAGCGPKWEGHGGGGMCTPHFTTGMGGFIQGITSGYGGVRFTHDDTLTLTPNLPPNTTRLTIAGIHFRGASLSLSVSASLAEVRLVRAPQSRLEMRCALTLLRLVIALPLVCAPDTSWPLVHRYVTPAGVAASVRLALNATVATKLGSLATCSVI